MKTALLLVVFLALQLRAVSACHLCQLEEEGVVTHEVVAGDTLSKLARSYGVTVPQIAIANDLVSDLIHVGDLLVIPVAQNMINPPSDVAPAAEDHGRRWIFHTVRRGDTLFQIAKVWGTSVDRIMAVNDLNGEGIEIGQVLRVPIQGTTSA